MARTNQSRERISLWVSKLANERVRRIAAEREATPSEVYRDLLRLGLKEYDKGQR